MSAIPRRRPRAAPAPASEPATDYGAQPWRSEVEDAADPDAPNRTIRRARRYDPLRRLAIEPALFVAAERFRDAYDLAEGAREGIGNVRLEPWQRCHYAARVADARQEVRDSLRAVGLRLSAVFVGAVIQYQPLRAIERELGMRSGTAPDRLEEALTLLLAWQDKNS